MGRPQDTVQGVRRPPCDDRRAYGCASGSKRVFSCTCVCGHHAYFREASRAALGFVVPCLRVCKVAPRQTTCVRPLVGSCVHDRCAQIGVFSVHARAWTEWSASMRGFRALGRPAPGVQICLCIRKSSSRPPGFRATSVTHCEPLNIYRAPS
jgi:hypothetical protein